MNVAMLLSTFLQRTAGAKTATTTMKKTKRSKLHPSTTGNDMIQIPSMNGSTAVAAVSKSSILSRLAVTKYETKKRQERMERFSTNPSHNSKKQRQEHQHQTTTTTSGDSLAEETEDLIVGPYYDIIGQNMEIEKSYLRLTTYPKCEDVRPLPILIKALDHVKRKYQQNDDFDWCNDQLKSIRQDITVQKSHIPTNHTLLLDVYQTHARILLEHGQLSEFNQCLSNVLQIYDALHADNNDNNKNNNRSHVNRSNNTSSRTTTMCAVKKAEGEFRAYSILYSLVQSKTTFLDLNMALRRRFQQQQHPMSAQPPQPQPPRTIKSNQKNKKRRRPSTTVTTDHSNDDHTSISGNIRSGWMNRISDEEQHAWDVVHSVYNGQYTKFFGLYDTAAHMSPYILDFLLHRVRLHAYQVLMASYRSSIPISYVQTSLHFDTIDELHHFLQQRGTVFVSTPASVASDDDNESNKSSDIFTTDKEHLLIDCRQSQLMLQSRNP